MKGGGRNKRPRHYTYNADRSVNRVNYIRRYVAWMNMEDAVSREMEEHEDRLRDQADLEAARIEMESVSSWKSDR